jgi:hypothetical protein
MVVDAGDVSELYGLCAAGVYAEGARAIYCDGDGWDGCMTSDTVVELNTECADSNKGRSLRNPNWLIVRQ